MFSYIFYLSPCYLPLPISSLFTSFIPRQKFSAAFSAYISLLFSYNSSQIQLLLLKNLQPYPFSCLYTSHLFLPSVKVCSWCSNSIIPSSNNLIYHIAMIYVYITGDLRGLEPPTLCVQNQMLSQLSYSPSSLSFGLNTTLHRPSLFRLTISFLTFCFNLGL